MKRPRSDRFRFRRARVVDSLRSEGVSAFLCSSVANVSYLTGFSGEDSYLYLSSKNQILISDFRFAQQIEEECPGLDAYLRKPGEMMPDAVARIVKKEKAGGVAFEANSMTVANIESISQATPGAEWKAAQSVVERWRMIKDDDEIRQIEEAIAIAEKSFQEVRGQLCAEMTEKQVADLMEATLRKNGARRSAFPSIIAAGPRAALPHAVATDAVIGQSPFLLLDWGAKGKFYNSDLTRVLARSRIPAKLSRVYQIVKEAQQRAIDAIRPGVSGDEVDAAARQFLASHGFGRAFGHGLGHGIGLEVHEGPALRKGSPMLLAPGMIVTVEPGVYLKGWGGVRIEDDILVTETGSRRLTTLPRNLEEMMVDY